MASGMTSRDVILETMESSMTRTSEKVGAWLESGYDRTLIAKTSKDKRSDGRDSREDCLDAMIGMTEVLNSTEAKVSVVRERYGRLFVESPLTSCLLRYLCRVPEMKIIVNCDSPCIGRVRTKAQNQDGMEWTAGNVSFFVNFQERKVYLGGKASGGEVENDVVGRFALAFARMVVYLYYGNGGRPYLKGDEGGERIFQWILEEAKEKVRGGGGGADLDECIISAVTKNTQSAQMISLISTVPRMIAYYGSSEGTLRLERQMPSLLHYYREQLMEPLINGL